MVEGILNCALGFWNMMFGLISNLLGTSPQAFGDNGTWTVISNINGALQAIGLALMPIFFMFGMVKASASYIEYKRPEAIGKVLIRFVISWAVIVFGMDLLMYIWNISQRVTGTILSSSGFQATELSIPQALSEQLARASFFDKIFLWILAAIGTLIIMALSVIVLFSVYGRFFRIYLYIALAPIPLSTLAGEPTQRTGISFIRGFASVCLEGGIIVLACIIFSLFATTSVFPMDPNNVWAALLSYLFGIIFNMLILVGIVKMADRVTREMLGL